MTFRPRAFLIDLSGTLHIENTALPGAIEAVGKIKDSKIPCLFVTSTTKVTLSSELTLRIKVSVPCFVVLAFVCQVEI